MYPQINNKQLLDCSYEDLTELLHNPDYREDQYLEYKLTFSFLNIPKNEAADKIIEFRNDICSFANAEGGYIIYGISDDHGIAADLTGVEIKDIDKFELNLRNRLTPVMPKVPPVTIRFISVDGKDNFYLVVVFVEHDYYAPYIHLENEKNYKIYKRDGNQKRVVGYTELKSMFVQSRILEDEILRFREKRIAYHKDKGIGERFMLLHIIPESFLNEKQSLFVIEKRRDINLGVIFAGSQIDSFSLPCVDGLRYTSASGDAEAILYNNGIAEFLLPLTIYVASMREGFYFCNEDIWEYVERISQGYQRTMTDIFGGQRYFGCISIIGCKDVISEDNGVGRQPTMIDRDEIICQPVCFMDMTDTDAFYSDLKKLHIEYLLSLGIRHNETITGLINEIREGRINVKNEV